jgi:hypothetical protein
MENEQPEQVLEICSFCGKSRLDVAFMCHGNKEGIAICNYCIGACLKAAGSYVMNNFIRKDDNGKTS